MPDPGKIQDSDREWLRSRTAPVVPQEALPLRIVDLFSGCGGLSLGMSEAARAANRRPEVALAVEADPEVAAVYRRNFGEARVISARAETLFDGDLGEPWTSAESRLRAIGEVDVLLGGPPCQGHSDLNNHTRNDDPKNSLYALMARAADVLNPALVVIENVAAVQRDAAEVLPTTVLALEKLGYAVHGRVVDMRAVGVPQRRRRYIVLASRLDEVAPNEVLDALADASLSARTVRWAVEDLEDADEASSLDKPSRMSPANQDRVKHLLDHGLYDLPNDQRPVCHRDGGHTYKSMYGRLRWDEPAQTITTGFTSMGQGRYVHPSKARTLTPREAARLQTFPDWFDWGTANRSTVCTMIGNAVPPLMMRELGSRVLQLL